MKENKYKTFRIRTFIVSVLTTIMCMGIANASDIFAELSGMPEVESTYVSGRFAHNKKYWYSSSGNHSVDLTRGFSALYSYDCYSEEAVKKARKLLDEYLKKNPDVEVMMKTVQGPQEYVIYEKFTADDKVAQMIIWNSVSSNACEIVVIDWNKGLEPAKSPYSYDLPSFFLDFDLVINE